METLIFWIILLPVILLPILLRTTLIRRWSQRFRFTTLAIATVSILVAYPLVQIAYYELNYITMMALGPGCTYNGQQIICPPYANEKVLSVALELWLRNVMPFNPSSGCFSSDADICRYTDERMKWPMEPQPRMQTIAFALLPTLAGLGLDWLLTPWHRPFPQETHFP